MNSLEQLLIIAAVAFVYLALPRPKEPFLNWAVNFFYLTTLFVGACVIFYKLNS